MTPAERAAAAFTQAYGRAPTRLVRAPGRVNLIGEHTDYNDGFVLPCAIDWHIVVASGPADDGQVHVVSADINGADRFVPALPIARSALGWADYVRGVVAELAKAGHTVAPMNLAIAGDVPPGSGLSSSAALEVATALTFADATLDRETIALLCQRSENDFVGCSCGIMDQMISATARVGHAMLLDCRTLARRDIALAAEVAVVIVDSGVRHAHAGGDYNLRRAECDTAARHYGVRALRDLDEAALVARAEGLDPIAYRRARHVVTENARVLAAVDALAAGDLAAMGTLMAASHASMRDDFEITVPEVDRLVAVIVDVVGVRGGARMTGGGFGGCVVALVEEAEAAAVADAVTQRCRTPEGSPPAVFISSAAGGAGDVQDTGLA